MPTVKILLLGYDPRSMPRYWSRMSPAAPKMFAGGSDASRPSYPVMVNRFSPCTYTLVADSHRLIFGGTLYPICTFCSRVYDPDRKSTRLNSSHLVISHAVFCLKEQQSRS